MHCLFISNNFRVKVPDGGNVITQRNYYLLQSIFSEVDDFLLDSGSSNDLQSITEKIYYKLHVLYHAIFFHYISGMNHVAAEKLAVKLSLKQYDVIFINQSVYGKIAELIKRESPKSVVICFFHNIEYLYYKQLSQETSLLKMPLVWSAKYNEKIAVQYADKIIALNQRDAEGIVQIYHRKVDLLLPTTLCDRFDKAKISLRKSEKKIHSLLFVGSDFFANYHGIKWFVKSVLPHLKNINLKIVGKGTENWRKEFLAIGNIDVVGSTEHLDAYYYEADAVVLPIFLGSGMKTKTAEAFMYGRFVFGTPEAFAGYEVELDKVGGVCNDEKEFIDKLNRHFERCRLSYNHFSRELFEKYYSNEEAKCLLEELIDHVR